MPEVVKTAKILLLTDNDAEAKFMENECGGSADRI